MNNNIKKPKIALIGPYPPPYGGISVHIQRLKEQLAKKGYEYIVYDLGGVGESPEESIVRIMSVKRWLPKYFFFAKEDIIHYHNPNWILRIIFGLMSFLGKKTIISIHGESLNDSLKSAGWLRTKTIIFALKHTSCIIALNQKIKELVLSLGIAPENIEVIPSFIPPTIRKEEISEIPQEIGEFMNSHNPVIAANASTIRFYNNQDLYGVDMCIDLCANLKHYYPDIGLVFSLPDIGDYDYFNKMKRSITEKDIKNNFLFITEQYHFHPILMKCDVFVRPTNVDGYGISIAEAIYFKVPAVASDVCPRTEGTILFKSRDINEFFSKVKNVLDKYEVHKKRMDEVRLADNAEKIIKVYQKQGKGVN